MSLYIRCPEMDEENELIALRRKKLAALRAKAAAVDFRIDALREALRAG